MDKKKILWIAATAVAVLVLAIGGFVGYRFYARSQAGFRGGPGRGFGNRFVGEGDRAFGEVVSVGDDTLTIANQDGEQLSFRISAETQFFSQDSSLNELQDLEVGMSVSILYESLGEDELSAISVGTGQGQQRPGGEHQN